MGIQQFVLDKIRQMGDSRYGVDQEIARLALMGRDQVSLIGCEDDIWRRADEQPLELGEDFVLTCSGARKVAGYWGRRPLGELLSKMLAAYIDRLNSAVIEASGVVYCSSCEKPCDAEDVAGDPARCARCLHESIRGPSDDHELPRAMIVAVQERGSWRRVGGFLSGSPFETEWIEACAASGGRMQIFTPSQMEELNAGR